MCSSTAINNNLSPTHYWTSCEIWITQILLGKLPEFYFLNQKEKTWITEIPYSLLQNFVWIRAMKCLFFGWRMWNCSWKTSCGFVFNVAFVVTNYKDISSLDSASEMFRNSIYGLRRPLLVFVVWHRFVRHPWHIGFVSPFCPQLVCHNRSRVLSSFSPAWSLASLAPSFVLVCWVSKIRCLWKVRAWNMALLPCVNSLLKISPPVIW